MRWLYLPALFAKWRQGRLLKRGKYLIDLSLRWHDRWRRWSRVSESELAAELTRNENPEGK